MIQRISLGLLALLACSSYAPSSFALSARAALAPGAEAACEPSQAPDKGAQVPDKRPEVEKLTLKLKSHVDKKGTEDTDAVQVIDNLNQEFPNSGPKDRQAIVAAIAKCLDARRQGVDENTPNNKLFIGAAAALGQMGPESTKPLIQWVGAKDHKKDIQVMHRLILSLGNTKDKGAVDTLTKLLVDKDNAIIAAASEALGSFASADLETRKKCFEELLKNLMSAQGNKDSSPQDMTAADKFNAVSAAMIASLQKLSKQTEVRKPDEFQKFWNKNKSKNWDDDK